MLTRPKCYRGETPFAGKGARLSVAAALTWGKPLVDFLARGADRIALRVPARHPDLAAERGQRRAEYRTVDDFVFLHVVREPLVIAITVRRVGPGALVGPRAL